jgi:hypothetical protein
MQKIRDDENSTTMVQLRVHELVDLMNDGSEASAAQNLDTQLRRAGANSAWYGGETTQAGLDKKMREGWGEGLKRIAKTAKSLGGDLGAVKARKRRRFLSEDEGELDVERLHAGDDLFLVDTRKEWSAGNKYVQIASSWGGNAMVRADEMFFTGAIALILTNKLEDAGYRVRLTFTRVGHRQNEGFDYSIQQVIAKEYEEPLDVDGLATMACHAGVFRTYGFRASYENDGEPAGNMGYSKDILEREAVLKKHGWLEEGAQTIRLVRTAEEAIEEAQRILKALAV